jgi:hypothetical protein
MFAGADFWPSVPAAMERAGALRVHLVGEAQPSLISYVTLLHLVAKRANNTRLLLLLRIPGLFHNFGCQNYSFRLQSKERPVYPQSLNISHYAVMGWGMLAAR